LLGKGLFLDSHNTTTISKFPVYEILTYLTIKYQDYFEHINENDLADQISCWYYAHLLVPSLLSSKKTTLEQKPRYEIFAHDIELRQWYREFFDEMIDFYQKRFKIVKNLKKTLVL
jgi:hypothetical protein